jgi:hypothetical protein
MVQQRGTEPSNAETLDPDDMGLPRRDSRPASKQERHQRLGLVRFVRAMLSLLVIILVVGLVMMALAVIGTYIVHLFAPESWHWLTDQQMARLHLL